MIVHVVLFESSNVLAQLTRSRVLLYFNWIDTEAPYSASLHSRLRFLAQGLLHFRSGNEPPQSRRPVTNLPDVHYQLASVPPT